MERAAETVCQGHGQGINAQQNVVRTQACKNGVCRTVRLRLSSPRPAAFCLHLLSSSGGGGHSSHAHQLERAGDVAPRQPPLAGLADVHLERLGRRQRGARQLCCVRSRRVCARRRDDPRCVRHASGGGGGGHGTASARNRAHPEQKKAAAHTGGSSSMSCRQHEGARTSQITQGHSIQTELPSALADELRPVIALVQFRGRGRRQGARAWSQEQPSSCCCQIAAVAAVDAAPRPAPPPQGQRAAAHSVLLLWLCVTDPLQLLPGKDGGAWQEKLFCTATAVAPAAAAAAAASLNQERDVCFTQKGVLSRHCFLSSDVPIMLCVQCERRLKENLLVRARHGGSRARRRLCLGGGARSRA